MTIMSTISTLPTNVWWPIERDPAVKRLAVVLAILTVGFFSSCAANDQRAEIRAEGASALPSGSLRDWVTYGDYVVVWEATSERRLPPTPEEIEHNEGTITRLVTVNTSQILWRRPSAPKALSAPKSLEVANGGWVFHGNDEKPFVVDDRPRLELGQRYLAVLTYADLSVSSTRPQGPQWLTFGYFALKDGAVVANNAGDASGSDLDRLINGKGVGAVQALVASTPVDPDAKRYLGLDPVLRYQRVAEDRIASSSYTPGPGPGEKE